MYGLGFRLQEQNEMGSLTHCKRVVATPNYTRNCWGEPPLQRITEWIGTASRWHTKLQHCRGEPPWQRWTEATEGAEEAVATAKVSGLYCAMITTL